MEKFFTMLTILFLLIIIFAGIVAIKKYRDNRKEKIYAIITIVMASIVLIYHLVEIYHTT